MQDIWLVLLKHLWEEKILYKIQAIYLHKHETHHKQSRNFYFQRHQIILLYCAFQKQANSEVQKPIDVCIFHCHRSSKRTSWETELYLNGFTRSWFVICDWWISIIFVCFCVSRFLLVIVIMIDGSKKCNCEGGFWTLEFCVFVKSTKSVKVVKLKIKMVSK